MKLSSYLSTCTKLNSKWIKDLGFKSETLCLVEEKVGPILHPHKAPKVKEAKSRINKWNGFKLKISSLQKKQK